MKLGICKVLAYKFDIEQIAKERQDFSGDKPLFQVKALNDKSTSKFNIQ